MKPWNVILAAVIIFASGILTGTLVSSHRPVVPAAAEAAGADKTRTPAPGPAPLYLQRADFLRKIEKNLNLSTEQKQKIEKIMHESHERTKPLWDQIAPQMHEESKRVREEIRAELTPDQQQKFEALLKPHPKKDDDGKSPDRRRHPKADATNSHPALTNSDEVKTNG